MKPFTTTFKRTAAAAAAAVSLSLLSAGTAQAVTPGKIKLCNSRDAGISVQFLDRGGLTLTPVRYNYANCVLQPMSSRGPENVAVSAIIPGSGARHIGTTRVDIRKGVQINLTAGRNPGFLVSQS
ncbi:hypothetical protein [Lentzea sp. NBRC 102530]|uniref:hypothetical protein n=1 Tax=Lentzea sp. NBRC 102530 TaxID=3032201 RepID=UPI0024A1F216|nr:hypothetical protein [Lentzea sp. NBRC 102530]GLY54499.1 hypothetical protein Lesp01_81550 [Lentzea sp. NBRC 102530]